MTKQEAIYLVEMWIQEHSLLAAQVVSARQDEYGGWVMQAECSAAIWQQRVSLSGEVGAPELLDVFPQDSDRGNTEGRAMREW